MTSLVERVEHSVRQFFIFLGELTGLTPERQYSPVEHFLLYMFNIKPKRDVTVKLSEIEYVDLLIWILIIFVVFILISGVINIIVHLLKKNWGPTELTPPTPPTPTKISNISFKYVKNNILIDCDRWDHCYRFIPELANVSIQSAILKISNIVPKRDEKTPDKIVVVDNVDNVQECNDIVRVLKSDCEKYPILGFDCEWVPHGKYRNPVSLLQLATHTGLCVLFRLCYIGKIPESLKELLEDDEIIKVGVAPDGDVKHLEEDYLTFSSGILELNRMAEVAGEPVLNQAMGLKRLSEKYLNIELDKDKSITLSNWEKDELSKDQIKYAAYDAFVGIELFKYFAKKISPNLEESLRSCSQHIIINETDQFAAHDGEVEYKAKFRSDEAQTSFDKQSIDLHFEKRHPLRCFAFNTNNFSRTAVSHDLARQYLESREAVLISPCAIRIIPKGDPFVQD